MGNKMTKLVNGGLLVDHGSAQIPQHPMDDILHDADEGLDAENIPKWFERYTKVQEEKIKKLEASLEQSKKQIDALRGEIIAIKRGEKTAILEIRDNWRSHEDEDWLLPHITEFYKEMKEKHKGDRAVLEELDQLYEAAKSKRNRRTFGRAATAGACVAVASGITVCVMSLEVAAAAGFLAFSSACCLPLAVCAVAGLGVFALVAGGRWIYIGLKKRKETVEEKKMQ